jgi:hypothetical protein
VLEEAGCTEIEVWGTLQSTVTRESKRVQTYFQLALKAKAARWERFEVKQLRRKVANANLNKRELQVFRDNVTPRSPCPKENMAARPQFKKEGLSV